MLHSPNMTLTRDAIIGFIVLAVIIIGIVWYAVSHPPAAPTSTTEAPVGTALGPQHITDSGEFYQVDVQYPGSTVLKQTVSAEADAAAVLAMKTYLSDMLIPSFMEGVTGNNQMVADMRARGEEIPESFQHLSLMAEYQSFQSTRTASYVYLVSEDTGGAHPNSYYKTFTFDTQTGANLALGDLFASSTDYLGQLSKIARAELPAMIAARENVPVSEIDMQMLTDGTAPTNDNFADFYLDGDNLVVLFPPYAVGPYVLGSSELDVKRSDLQGLKPEYK